MIYFKLHWHWAKVSLVSLNWHLNWSQMERENYCSYTSFLPEGPMQVTCEVVFCLWGLISADRGLHVKPGLLSWTVSLQRADWGAGGWGRSQWLTAESSESVSYSVMSDSLWLRGLYHVRLLCPWNSPGKNTEVGSQSLLQGIFLTQGSNLSLLHCRQILYHLSHEGGPDNLIKTWGQTCLLWQNKLNTRHGTQRGSVRLLDQGRLQRQNDIWQQLRGKSWWWRKQKPLKSKAGRMSRLVQEWKIKTWVVPSYHFLKSLEIPSVNSWASLLRTLAPHSTCKIPRGVPSRKFCLLLLIKCLGLCLCAPGFNQEYEYLFLCHYPVQIYVKRQWQ